MQIYVTLFMDVHLRSAVRWERPCMWICFESVKGWSCCFSVNFRWYYGVTLTNLLRIHVARHNGAQIPGVRVSPSICGASGCLLVFVGSWVWKWLYVTLLAPRILRWLLDFWKIYGALSLRWICGHRVSCLWRSEGCSVGSGELLWCLCVRKQLNKMENVAR
jgi:hypothetical protein